MTIRKAGNAGLVTTIGGGAGFENPCHVLPIDTVTLTSRSVIIRKILAYNPGALTTLIFGTFNRAAVPAFVQILPTLVAIAGLDNEWMEVDLPPAEFQCNYTPNALLGRTGDIWVRDAGAGGVLIQIEVEEIVDSR